MERPLHIRDLRLRRDVQRLCRLGLRPVYELLKDIGAGRGIQTLIEDCAAAYSNIDADRLAAVGGDSFPPLPIHEVAK